MTTRAGSPEATFNDLSIRSDAVFRNLQKMAATAHPDTEAMSLLVTEAEAIAGEMRAIIQAKKSAKAGNGRSSLHEADFFTSKSMR